MRPALQRAGTGKRNPAQAAAGELPAPYNSEFVALESHAATPEMARAQEIFGQITEAMKREPAQSSRLLQSWIHSE